MLAWTKQNTMLRAMRTALESSGGHKVMQQANIINMITNKYEPQQKHRLGTVKAEIVPRDTRPLNTKQNA